MDIFTGAIASMFIGASALANAEPPTVVNPTIERSEREQSYVESVVVWPTPVPPPPTPKPKPPPVLPRPVVARVTTTLDTVVPRSAWCSCVEAAKYMTGHVGETWGWARSIKTNIASPSVGDLILTYESSAGHVGVTTAPVSLDGWIEFDDYNYKACQGTHRRLHIDDPIIRGFRKVN